LEIALFIYFSFPNYETYLSLFVLFRIEKCYSYKLIWLHFRVSKKLLRLKCKAYQLRGFVWKFAIMKITAVVLMLVVSMAMMGFPKTAVEANPNPSVSILYCNLS
jgi:hypothetical protein